MKKVILIFIMLTSLFVNSQTTQISAPYCGYTATSTAEFIWADSLGLPETTTNDRYIFKLVNGVTTLTWQTNNQWPILQWYLIPGFQYNTSYTASVAWSSDNGVTFGSFGSECTITSPPATIKLTTASCGSSPSTFYTTLFADQAVGATQYQYQLINSALSYTQAYTKSNNNFMLSQFTGLAYNTTYSVTVHAFVGGVWNPYGTSCNVTTPSAPTTSIIPADCGITATSNSQPIRLEASVGDSVAVKLINTSLSYTQTFKKINFNFNLSQFTGLSNSTTYSVSAAVRYNNVWGSFGNTCQITTNAAPTTSIINTECGTTATSFTNQMFHCIPVNSFQCYFYNFTDGVSTYTLEKCNNNNFILAQLGGLALNTTYSVTVKVKYNGVYGPFGNACTITTPSSQMRLSPYPNPFTEATELNIISETQSPIFVRVTNNTGKIVEQVIIIPKHLENIKLGSGYESGIYNVVLMQDKEIKSFKIIKE